MDGSIKKRRKLSGTMIVNILVIIISVSLVGYFFLSENGLVDLLHTQSINLFWISMAIVAQLFNILMDTIVTYNFIHYRYKFFTLWDAAKVCLVGQFFSAITPSSTGGQPMQVYLMAKMNISAGYGTSSMMQKFIVYQLTSTVYSLIAIAIRFDYFISTMNSPVMWAFVLVGFGSQMFVTFGLIVVSFNEKLSQKFVRLLSKIFHKLKFVKNPDGKIKTLTHQIGMFHESNKDLMKAPRLMFSSYILVFLQITAILIVPYFIYLAFNLKGAAPIDMICSQAYVNLASSLIPLPGASGAAELGFSAFFGMFFTSETIKSAILMWRIITYYGTILISCPFSYFTKDKHKHDINELAESMSADSQQGDGEDSGPADDQQLFEDPEETEENDKPNEKE